MICWNEILDIDETPLLRYMAEYSAATTTRLTECAWQFECQGTIHRSRLGDGSERRHSYILHLIKVTRRPLHWP